MNLRIFNFVKWIFSYYNERDKIEMIWRVCFDGIG